MDLLWLLALAPALVALVLFIYAFVAFGKRQVFGGLVRLVLALALFIVAGVAGLLALGSVGYRALLGEQLAATVQTESLEPQRYRATFTFPDGSSQSFELAGDQLYVDARILKWHPWVTLLGVETAYQLDRVAGRYLTLDDEQTAPRTVYQLADAPPVDLFTLAERYPPLTQLVDAEYGSATFSEVEDGGSYEVRVSSTGLLIRGLE